MYFFILSLQITKFPCKEFLFCLFFPGLVSITWSTSCWHTFCDIYIYLLNKEIVLCKYYDYARNSYLKYFTYKFWVWKEKKKHQVFFGSFISESTLLPVITIWIRVGHCMVPGRQQQKTRLLWDMISEKIYQLWLCMHDNYKQFSILNHWNFNS